MKKEYYVFDIKAVKLLDDETLLWMLISFEKLKENSFANAETESDKMFLQVYLKELKEEIIKQALKRKLIRPR